MTYQCKICGGSLDVDRATGIAVCEYCGTKQVLPMFSDDSSKRLYESGNNYLQHGEYDKAEAVFNQLLAINPQDAEIYWDLVLCKYGITFVCDPQTGKYIPTCNRTHYESIFNDKNYQNALRYSDREKAAFYKESAGTIDHIQKGILAVSRKEKPFDIFISYKETDAAGNRTKDSVVAQELYEKLTQSGYKVFFSRITLEDKIGSQYEPYIYAALSSSKVMLTVSSSRDNLEAPWVKNEWSRFLTLRQNDASKTLIPLYFGMAKEELPDEFAIFSAQDIGKENFEQELIRGIKKLIPLPIMLKEKRKKQRKALGIVAACFCVVAVVLTAVLMPTYINYSKYSAAMQLFENGEYEQAMVAFQNLGDFKDSQAMVEKCTKQPDYDAAMQLYYDGKYAEATWAFEKLGDYEDSAEMKQTAELSWRQSLATVATENLLSSSSYGSYYISANGTVENFSFDPGSSNENLNINEHGKIVSIADNFKLYALYEDGYVANSAENNGMDSDWTDVVQISPRFNSTNVALKNDGTVVYGNLQLYDDNDTWLEEVGDWNNIVSISYDLERYGYGGLIVAALVGIKSDGTVLSTLYNVKDADNAKSFLNGLREIVKIRVYVDSVKETIYIGALDSSGVLYTYVDGSTEKYSNLHILDFDVTLDYDVDVDVYDMYSDTSSDTVFHVYIVDDARTLSILNDNDTILNDVVYYKEPFAATQSGSIYRYGDDTGVKTQVQDVWLERD